MSTAIDWVAARDAESPAALRERIRGALEAARGPDDDVARSLLDASIECLRGVVQSGSDARSALDLLAADALLTYACEAAAGSGVPMLETFADGAVARLADLLPDATG